MGAEEDAAARRERLRALRAAKELLSTPDGAPTPATDGEQQYDLSSPLSLTR
jgi:coiled-coil domain-containing protein 12